MTCAAGAAGGSACLFCGITLEKPTSSVPVTICRAHSSLCALAEADEAELLATGSSSSFVAVSEAKVASLNGGVKSAWLWCSSSYLALSDWGRRDQVAAHLGVLDQSTVRQLVRSRVPDQVIHLLLTCEDLRILWRLRQGARRKVSRKILRPRWHL